MIATASPRSSVSEIPMRMDSSPRGVEYDLVMSATVSMSNQIAGLEAAFATDAYAASAVSAIRLTS